MTESGDKGEGVMEAVRPMAGTEAGDLTAVNKGLVSIEHLSVEERRARGKGLRKRMPPSSHGKWKPAADRPDPVELLTEQDARREPDLVPVRHGRMLVSPFTFYRGAARIMAADLKDTPRAGLMVQLCGDAHLSNFGVFASPERVLLFDLNDFDETLTGPFEYDVKRMAASFTIAARNNAFAAADVRTVTLASASAYRTAMAEFAQMRVMDIWYARLSEADIMAAISTLERSQRSKAQRKAVKRSEKVAAQSVAKAETRDSLQALSKLGELVDGRYRLVRQPPLVVPIREWQEAYGIDPDEVQQGIHDMYRGYRASLQPDRRHLLENFEIIDIARKVVGVGSVGTRCFIILLQGRDESDPLFLQVKEATASVLEDHLPKSRYRQPGQRVVEGQRLMQAASDIYLGWTKGLQQDRYFYYRQLRDMKGSAAVETMTPLGLEFYARQCAWTLARAHARSGDPIAIAAYLGKSDAFEQAIADFSERYAEQNERDYKAFRKAARGGKLEVVSGV
jgi:uncharacterized protein (DUF2252 family)